MLENQRRYPQVQKVQYSFTGVLEKESREGRGEKQACNLIRLSESQRHEFPD